MNADFKLSRFYSRVTVKALVADSYKKSISKLFGLFLHKSGYQANNSKITQQK